MSQPSLPIELVVDASGRVLFASLGARTWLQNMDHGNALAEKVRAIAAGVERTGGPAYVDNARIVRLDRNDGGVLFLVHIEPPTMVASVLTKTQRCVAERAALGMTITDVARELVITPHTVRSHLKEVYRRLNVANRVELANAMRDITVDGWSGH